MAEGQEKLLIDEEETVQIKDLNKVTTVNNDDLLLLDDGVASSNAITFKNFLKTVKYQTLTDSISSATLSKYDDLLIMSSSTIQKTPVPKQLLGVPSDFEHNRSSAYGNTIYNDEYTGKAVTINLKDYSNVNLIFYKYNDDNPIYLDIDISVEHNKNDSKKYLYLKYGDETEGYPVYYQKGSPKISTRIPMYKGWYIQKRDSWFGKPVPVLVKL
ncbi:DUF685 domain-containing protein [Borreliella bavariensis]|uniref:DUF685 domain-containing protein n=1 Tax=Borreliella bavariensis TaxID=664662 RepID=UPI001BFFFD36|nr:DUF685 domain-containing protein [Borreliella bavariensis]